MSIKLFKRIKEKSRGLIKNNNGGSKAKFLKKIRGEAFVNKIMRGERNFTDMQMTESYDISTHPKYKKFVIYLKNQNFSEKPIDISNSIFTGLQATGLNLEHLRAVNAELGNSNFEGSNLSKANFKNSFMVAANFVDSDIRGATFTGANLTRVDFTNADARKAVLVGSSMRGAILKNANLSSVDFSDVNLRGVDFEDADMNNIKNLHSAKNLSYSIFYNVKNCCKETKELVEEAMDQRKNSFFAN